MITYGIDLGTTYCAVARMDVGRSPTPIPVQFDDGGAFPSLVLLAPGRNEPRVIVGPRSREEYARLVGKRYDPPPGVHLIRGAKNHIGRPGKSTDDSAGPPWTVDGHEFTPTDISALILRALRRRVEMQNLPLMDRVVVTHPQKFRNLQRLATKQAVHIAGLNLVGMLTEPDAAAWAYENDSPSNKGQKTLVFDFGGGTLDVVLMEAGQDEKGATRMRVVASEGGSCGGLEIDELVSSEIYRRYLSEADLDEDEDQRAQARDEFLAKAEWAKRRLNHVDAAHDPDWRDHRVQIVLDNLAGYDQAKVLMELGQMSDWISPVLDRAMRTVKIALQKGNWQSADVHVVRMTGQSSMLVPMRKRLEAEFKNVVLDYNAGSYLHPATIVAAGASLAGHHLTDSSGIVGVQGAISEPIYFTSRLSEEDAGAEIFEGIPAGTPTPAHIVKRYRLSIAGSQLPDGGRTLPIEVFEGPSKTPIGKHSLTFDAPLKDGQPVEVSFDFGRNGLFSMGVQINGTTRQARLQAEGVYDEKNLREKMDLISTLPLEV